MAFSIIHSTQRNNIFLISDVAGGTTVPGHSSVCPILVNTLSQKHLAAVSLNVQLQRNEAIGFWWSDVSVTVLVNAQYVSKMSVSLGVRPSDRTL